MSNIDYQTSALAPGGVFTDAVLSIVSTNEGTSSTSAQIIVRQDNINTTLGGNIDSTKLYRIDGDLDFTGVTITVPSTGLFIAGYNLDLSVMRCSDANYTMFQKATGSTTGSVFLNFLSVQVDGTNSQVFDLEGTGAQGCELNSVNFNNCTSLGTISTYRQGLETGTGRFGGTPQLTLDGAWTGGYFIEVSITRGLTAGSYAIYKAGATFTMASRFRSNGNVDLPTSTNLTDFTNSNFTNPSNLQFTDMLVTRNGVTNPDDTDINPNITQTELSSRWKNNIGLRNTHEGGRLNITSAAATSISVTDQWETIAGTWATSELEHFDSPSNGQLRHLANFPREYKITVNFSAESALNNVVGIRYRRFDSSEGTFSNSREIVRATSNNILGDQIADFNFIINIELDENDYVFFQTRNRSGTSNITLEVDSEFTLETRP